MNCLTFSPCSGIRKIQRNARQVAPAEHATFRMIRYKMLFSVIATYNMLSAVFMLRYQSFIYLSWQGLPVT